MHQSAILSFIFLLITSNASFGSPEVVKSDTDVFTFECRDSGSAQQTFHKALNMLQMIEAMFLFQTRSAQKASNPDLSTTDRRFLNNEFGALREEVVRLLKVPLALDSGGLVLNWFNGGRIVVEKLYGNLDEMEGRMLRFLFPSFQPEFESCTEWVCYSDHAIDNIDSARVAKRGLLKTLRKIEAAQRELKGLFSHCAF